jgi:hypothetical protein
MGRRLFSGPEAMAVMVMVVMGSGFDYLLFSESHFIIFFRKFDKIIEYKQIIKA